MGQQKQIITVWENADSMATAAAHAFVQDVKQAIADHGHFTIALSGGNTPATFFRQLAQPAFSRNIPWHKIHVCWSDERWVAHDHPDSNYRMAKEILLDHVPLTASHIHPIPFRGKPEQAAAKYEQSIHRILKHSKGAFDWIMLGLGNDGHTASLFPGTTVLTEKKKWVSAVWVEEKQTHRISFTYPLINRAAKTVFLVSGPEKAAVVTALLGKAGNKNKYPAARVHPVKGINCWFLDAAAAAGIQAG